MLGFLAKFLKLFLELFQVLVRKILEIHQRISRAFKSTDNFVQLQMYCFGVAVLGVLDEKDHQKRNNGCARINDELPCVREMKRWSSECPNDDDDNGAGKGPGAAQNNGGLAGEDAKCITNNAKEIPLSLVFFEFLDLSFLHALLLVSRASLQPRA
jgi:hypothetical protein